MNGMEIISKQPIKKITPLSVIECFVRALILAGVVNFVFYLKNEKNISTWVFAIIIFVAASIISGIGTYISDRFFTKDTGYSWYNMKIAEGSDTKEFSNTYKIVKKYKDGTFLVTDNLNYKTKNPS